MSAQIDKRNPKLGRQRLNGYPAATGWLLYKDGRKGVLSEWFIGADPKRDNQESLEAHLQKHFPGAVLIAWDVQ
jgi:hypothetical protein